MGLARRDLRRESRAGFWKLCGSGTGEGFTPRPNWGVWAILATWPDEATARAATATSPVWARWRGKARESWTVFLDPVSARGAWAGVNPFPPTTGTPTTGTPTTGMGGNGRGGPNPPDPAQGPLAALTRATLRPSRALKFWDRVPSISACIGADPNVAFKIGIGEVPLLHQVTFSIWPDAASMAAFARGDGPHGRAIRAVRDGNWFNEELYARFRILGSSGTWDGADPLARLAVRPAASRPAMPATPQDRAATLAARPAPAASPSPCPRGTSPTLSALTVSS